MSEAKNAVRTWFLTLTFRPDFRSQARSRAAVRLARSGVDLDALGQREQYEELVKEYTPETQQFIKRVRKNSGRHIRYLLVWEAHKSGDPHAHMLLHEVDGSVTYRVIEDAWQAGFSQAKLIPAGDPRAVAYATKYISKSAQTRVRASTRYGSVDSWLIDAGEVRSGGASPAS